MDEFEPYLFHFVTSEFLMHQSCSDFFVSRVFLYRNIEDIREENTACLDFVTMFMNENYKCSYIGRFATCVCGNKFHS